jgi:hypothetical protein
MALARLAQRFADDGTLVTMEPPSRIRRALTSEPRPGDVDYDDPVSVNQALVNEYDRLIGATARRVAVCLIVLVAAGALIAAKPFLPSPVRGVLLYAAAAGMACSGTALGCFVAILPFHAYRRGTALSRLADSQRVMRARRGD